MAHDWSFATTPLGDSYAPRSGISEVPRTGRIEISDGTGAESGQGKLSLCVVLAGAATYGDGDDAVSVLPRSIVWLFPDQARTPSRVTPDYQAWVVTFESELVERVCSGPAYEALRERSVSSAFHRHLGKTTAKRLCAQFDALSAAGLDAEHFNAGLTYLLLSAWAEYQKAADSREAASLHPAVEKAARILRAEPATGSLDELAKTCGASASWLSRLFRQQMSVSLVDFRNHCRIERFFQLYRDGQHRNIADAAFEAGFGSYAQFHRVFRKKLGYGPAELRRRVQAEPDSAVRSYLC